MRRLFNFILKKFGRRPEAEVKGRPLPPPPPQRRIIHPGVIRARQWWEKP